MTMLPEWVQWINHIFPLTWDYKFIRDIVIRGASFQDCAITIGQFLIYGAVVVGLFVLRYYKMQGEYEKRKAYEQSIEVNWSIARYIFSRGGVAPVFLWYNFRELIFL